MIVIIVSCIRKRIDFLTGLKGQGFEIFLPREVLQELKDLKKKSSTSQEDRLAINVAFEMFEKEDFKKISLGGNNVDLRLNENGNNGFFIATLDAEIKNSIPNKIVIFSSKKSVGRE